MLLHGSPIRSTAAGKNALAREMARLAYGAIKRRLCSSKGHLADGEHAEFDALPTV